MAVFYNLWLKYMFMKYLDGLNPLKITAKMENKLKMMFTPLYEEEICETNEFD